MPSGSGITLRTSAEDDIPTPDTDQITIFNDSDAGNAPAYKDDGGMVTPLQGAAGDPGADAPPLTYLDHSNTGSTETVDAGAADLHRLVADAATVTLTLTGWPASGTPGIVQLWLEQDGTGGRDWVFPGSVTWGDADEPDWTARAGGAVDLVALETVDGGTHVVAILQGRPGATGAAGVDGTVGGAISIDYTFSTTTTDSDPGSGNLRLSNATQTSATVIRADLLDAHGVDWTAVLGTLADASNTVKGHIRLFKKSDPTKWLVYTVSAVATPSGYRNITVANVGSSGVNPLGNGDAITLAFSRAGDQGSTVGSGTLTTIEEADGSPTDSAVTKLIFPNGTLGIASHEATYTPARPTPLAFAQAAITHQTSNTTNAMLDMTDATVTLTTGARRCRVSYVCYVENTGTGGGVSVRAVLDGTAINTSGEAVLPPEVANAGGTVSATFLTAVLSAASHTFKLQFNRTLSSGDSKAGSTTFVGYLLVEETEQTT